MKKWSLTKNQVEYLLTISNKNKMKKWMLTENQVEQLNQEEKDKYLRAVQYKQNSHAGGGDGWSVGNEILISLGWKEVEERFGHRVFVSLQKPERFQ